jgi:hypothetical protein
MQALSDRLEWLVVSLLDHGYIKQICWGAGVAIWLSGVPLRSELFERRMQELLSGNKLECVDYLDRLRLIDREGQFSGGRRPYRTAYHIATQFIMPSIIRWLHHSSHPRNRLITALNFSGLCSGGR